MELSRAERWILANQYRILAGLDPEHSKQYEWIAETLENGYELLYRDVCPVSEDTLSPEDCRDVLDILSMYRALLSSFQSLPQHEQDEINENDLRFQGFDGNEETKYMAFAEHFCNQDPPRFPELTQHPGFSFNSHRPMLDRYRRMLDIWRQCENKVKLSKEDIIRIIGTI